MATPGPNSKTKAIEKNEVGPIPSPPVDIGGGVSLDQLTPEQIKARLAVRERDLQYHVAALKHEATTVFDGVVVDGRPLMDRIRERPDLYLGGAAAVGTLVGTLLGLWARARRRPAEPEDHVEFVRARLDLAVDRAAERVARGASVEQAMEASMATVPAVFGDVRRPERLSLKGPNQTAFDVAVQTAIGFGVKAVMDVLVRRYTDSDGTLDALVDATD